MRLALLVAVPLMGPQLPVFRSSTEAVVVDVSVSRDGRPVTGLNAGDFRLTDNGSIQTITEVVRETLPIDVTLVLDLGSSIEGPALDALRRAVDDVLARLQPDDRAGLVVFDQRIREVVDFERKRLQIIVDPSARARGPTALLDALAVSLVRPTDPARRSMAIAFTDGKDFGSFLDEPDLVDVAARGGVTVFIVAVTDGTSRVPQRPANPALLRALAEATGGAVTVLQRDQDLGGSFVAAVDDFRTSYVLRYTPTGIRAAGWHAIEVGLARQGGAVVRARKGYFATPAPRAP
jgi:VWFA-related protein